MQKLRCLTLVLGAACIAGLCLSGPAISEPRLGITTLTTQVAQVPVSVRVFYPTQSDANKTAFGPWVIDAARDAPPMDGPFPLVMVSHGLGGTNWNHHLLAEKLVSQGMVVAAVQHPDDLKRVGTQAILVLRPLEVSAALDAVLADKTLGAKIDATRIGAFGYSQGGLSVLRLLGAEADHSTLVAHCQANRVADDEFCTGRSAGLWARLAVLLGKALYSAPDYDPNAKVADPRIQTAVIAAPVGAPVTDLSNVKAPLWLMRLGNDQVITFPFHVERIHKELPIEHRYSVLEGAHHYAMLSPFPASIADEVGLPAQDPDGFDRAAFLQKINQEITLYFADQLTDAQ